MDKYIEKLAQAIHQRKSVRSFEAKILTEKDRQMLEDFIKSINFPFDNSADIMLYVDKNSWGWKYPDMDAGIAYNLNLKEAVGSVIWEFKLVKDF
jgi:long-subunit fatty acid transport protein